MSEKLQRSSQIQAGFLFFQVHKVGKGILCKINKIYTKERESMHLFKNPFSVKYQCTLTYFLTFFDMDKKICICNLLKLNITSTGKNSKETKF